nr:protein plant cadmium resistance 6-like [Tanacetum cinerariifolium]
MGRLDTNPPPQSSDQTPFQAPPQGYPNHHDNPLAPPPPAPAPTPAPADTHVADQNNNHPQTTARSFVPQSSPESMPPPESYPPQKPSTYPPQQPAAAYPPQPTPVQFPPQQEPVQFPPPQQHTNAQQYTPQSNFNYAAQPQPMNYVGQQGYQTPMKMGPPDGIPVGSQFLAPTQGWTTDLFDCAEDPENAIITACFPCITFGQIAEIVDNGQTSCATSGLLYGVIGAFIGMPCIMSCSYRTKIRSRYGLMESPGPDWVTHFFCEWCALCQEYRELKARGLDPAIGWQGNLMRNGQQMQQYPAMTPPMNQTMM